MERNPIIAALLSTFVPGLGQIYANHSKRGASILIAVIVIGNLNAIWLSIFASTTRQTVPHVFWGYTLPRGLHDLLAIYGLVFLIWQIIDAYLVTRNTYKGGALSV